MPASPLMALVVNISRVSAVVNACSGMLQAMWHSRSYLSPRASFCLDRGQPVGHHLAGLRFGQAPHFGNWVEDRLAGTVGELVFSGLAGSGKDAIRYGGENLLGKAARARPGV